MRALPLNWQNRTSSDTLIKFTFAQLKYNGKLGHNTTNNEPYYCLQVSWDAPF